MKEINYEELEDVVLTVESEDGEKADCTMICIFELEGQDYSVFAEDDQEDAEEKEVYFFAVDPSEEQEDGPGVTFSLIEDEDLLNTLLEIFQQMIDDEFGEDDEEEDDEPEEDDSKWDEFINKKLD